MDRCDAMIIRLKGWRMVRRVTGRISARRKVRERRGNTGARHRSGAERTGRSLQKAPAEEDAATGIKVNVVQSVDYTIGIARR